ncbi:MAG: TetR family transcriptional regulator [Nevskia sp.]|nr:TetR family transcriptional regulator [Nevskia sp.]
MKHSAKSGGGNGSGKPARVSRHPAFDRDDQFQRRRLAMLETAIHFFNRSGFHATSMEAIATQLGLTKGTLYHYYESKLQLLYECMLHSVEEGRVVALQAQDEGGSGAQKLERFLRLQFRTLAGHSGSSWIFADISALPAEEYAEVRRRQRVVDQLVQQFIAQGVADGSLEATNPKIAEFFLMGALNWLPRWFRPEGPMTSEELADIFIRMVFDGVRAKPGAAGG